MAPKPLQVLSEKGGGGYITEGDSLYIGYNVSGIVHANAKCERQQVK